MKINWKKNEAILDTRNKIFALRNKLKHQDTKRKKKRVGGEVHKLQSKTM